MKENQTDLLNATIISLKAKRAQELVLLKMQFDIAYESIKPVNLIKNSLNKLIGSPEIKSDSIDAAMEFATGYLSKKILVGSSKNPLKRIAGEIVQFAVGNIVSKHAGTIKLVGEYLIQRMKA